MGNAKDNLPPSRRGFFREAMKGLLKPALAALESRLGLKAKDEPAGTPLRPPGAVEGIVFEQLCDRCGRCAQACPAQAIELSPLPQIVPSRRPCTMCEGLKCIAACPTGALRQARMGQDALPAVEQVRMGVAVWCPTRCRLRQDRAQAAAGVSPVPPACDICRQACPIEGALTIRENAVIVDGAKCAGCGMCEYLCPQRPRAIQTDPL